MKLLTLESDTPPIAGLEVMSLKRTSLVISNAIETLTAAPEEVSIVQLAAATEGHPTGTDCIKKLHHKWDTVGSRAAAGAVIWGRYSSSDLG